MSPDDKDSVDSQAEPDKDSGAGFASKNAVMCVPANTLGRMRVRFVPAPHSYNELPHARIRAALRGGEEVERKTVR